MLRISKNGAALTVGSWAYRATATVRARWGWVREGEGPGCHASLNLWRLSLYGGIGGFWQDEDGEDRSVVHLSATFKTYGITYIPCLVRGHKPNDSLIAGYVYCDRCQETLEYPPRESRRAA